jgi:2-dehydro-3-deoxyglucarate aldolase
MSKMSLKQKLKNNELTISSWIMMRTPMSIIDIEHISIDLQTVEFLITTIQSKSIKALVRVSKNKEVVIKRVLDMGANGIIVPMVNSKEDAIKVVEYAKYPLLSKRGVGLDRASGYRNRF